MATASTPLAIPVDSQAKVVAYLQSALDQFATSYNIRTQMEMRDRAYYRTQDQSQATSRAKAANNQGDPTKLQNITVPVVMPQVETALAELEDIFLTGYPIFGVVAPPEQQDAAEMMEAQIADNSIRGMWANELLLAMRDGLKYDLGAIEAVWENRKIFAITTPSNKALTEGQATETYYKGNFLRRLDPYNLILDTRVSPEKNHTHGEFAGYTEVISRIQLKKEMEDLPALGTMNFRAALESPSNGIAGATNISSSFYLPQINPDALLPVESRREHNWLAWAGLEPEKTGGIVYQNSYERTVLYCRILPSDFKLSVANKNHVQIWKFTIVNRKVVIFAERQTNAHNFLPIVCCKPSNDGMGWQSKSFAENVIGIQQVSSGLVNSGMESQRRKVYDRLIYDPSRVNKKDIDVVSSVARIAVKSSQYGKPLSEAIYQIPYRDDGVAEVMSLSQQIAQMGDVVNGTNRVQQGQFQKGNKTRQEFDVTMNNASNRGRMRALGLEAAFFMPLKEIVKSNILQYMQPGPILNQQLGTEVAVDPQKLREANLQMKMSDGYMSSEKLASTELMGTLFQAAQALPQIAVEYDLMGMLIYSMRLKGASWLNSFKRTPEQQQAQVAQMSAASEAAGQRNPPPPASPPGAP